MFRYTIWLNFIFVLKCLAGFIEQYFVKDFSSPNKCRCLKLNTLFVKVYYMIRFIFVPIRHKLLVNVDFVHFQHKFSSKIPKQLLIECAWHFDTFCVKAYHIVSFIVGLTNSNPTSYEMSTLLIMNFYTRAWVSHWLTDILFKLLLSLLSSCKHDTFQRTIYTKMFGILMTKGVNLF